VLANLKIQQINFMINIEQAKSILVPHDFTPVGDAALYHANLFAKKLNKSVVLLHVIENHDQKEEAMQKLEAIASTNKKATWIDTGYTTSTGSFIEQIGIAADILNAAFVIMGTHGIKGMQKITGSLALKVITKSHTPYIVVQKSPPLPTYNNIIVPINYEPESKQPVFHIMNIAKCFNATCHIVYPMHKDEHISKKIANNVSYCINLLIENNIHYKSVCMEGKSSDFHELYLDYADKNKADLITLITEQNISLVEFILQPAEQYIIANDFKIPVMCIHPDYIATKYGSVFAS